MVRGMVPAAGVGTLVRLNGKVNTPMRTKASFNSVPFSRYEHLPINQQIVCTAKLVNRFLDDEGIEIL